MALTTLIAPETAAQRIARLKAKGLGAQRILAACGYPGYGRSFAAAVIARVEQYAAVDLTVGDVIGGGIEAARKVEAAEHAA